MVVQKHHIAIVEDLRSWQQELVRLCTLAATALMSDEQRNKIYGTGVKATDFEIHSLNTLESASEYLQASGADTSLLILDLHLNAELGFEVSVNHNERNFKGFELLKQLNEQVYTIVVSAEEAQQAVIDSLVQYRTLGFISKTSISSRALQQLIQLVLLYKEATELLKNANWWQLQQALGLWTLINERLKECTYKPIFPLNIHDYVSKQVNTLTGLPNNEWSHRYLYNLLKKEGKWGTLHILITGLEDFTRAAQATDPEEVNKFLSNILKECLITITPSEYDFIGHFRGGYIIATDMEYLRTLKSNIEASFSQNIGPFYNAVDRHSQYMILEIRGIKRKVPLMALEFVTTTCADKPNSLLDLIKV